MSLSTNSAALPADSGRDAKVGSGEESGAATTPWWGARTGDVFDEPLADYLGPPPDGERWTQSQVDEIQVDSSETEEGGPLARFFVGCAVRYMGEILQGPRRCVAWTTNFGVAKPCARGPSAKGPLEGLLCSSHKARGFLSMSVEFTDFVVRVKFAFDEEMYLDLTDANLPLRFNPNLDPSEHIISTLATLARQWAGYAPESGSPGTMHTPPTPGPSVSRRTTQLKGKTPLDRSRSPSTSSVLPTLLDAVAALAKQVDTLSKRLDSADAATARPGTGLPPPPAPGPSRPAGAAGFGPRLPPGLDLSMPALPRGKKDAPGNADPLDLSSASDDSDDGAGPITASDVNTAKWVLPEGMWTEGCWMRPADWVPYFCSLEDPNQFELHWSHFMNIVKHSVLAKVNKWDLRDLRVHWSEIRTMLQSAHHLTATDLAVLKHKVVLNQFALLKSLQGPKTADKWYRALHASDREPAEWRLASRAARLGDTDGVLGEAARLALTRAPDALPADPLGDAPSPEPDLSPSPHLADPDLSPSPHTPVSGRGGGGRGGRLRGRGGRGGRGAF